MGCEPNFNGQANSLWLYQNDMGALIYHAIDALESNLAVQLSPVPRNRIDFRDHAASCRSFRAHSEAVALAQR